MTFWDFWAPFYDSFEVLNKAYRQMINKVCELTPLDSNILELAGGTGNLSLALSTGAKKVLCTDISDNMLKVAKRKASRRKINNVSFENINLFETSLPDNSFDVVVASQVFHLIDEPEKACAEIKRITKSMAIIPIPLLKGGIDLGRFLIGTYKVFGFAPKHSFDKESCKEFLEEIGFDNCEFHFIDGTVSLCIAVWRA